MCRRWRRTVDLQLALVGAFTVGVLLATQPGGQEDPEQAKARSSTAR